MIEQADRVFGYLLLTVAVTGALPLLVASLAWRAMRQAVAFEDSPAFRRNRPVALLVIAGHLAAGVLNLAGLLLGGFALFATAVMVITAQPVVEAYRPLLFGPRDLALSAFGDHLARFLITLEFNPDFISLAGITGSLFALWVTLRYYARRHPTGG